MYNKLGKDLLSINTMEEVTKLLDFYTTMKVPPQTKIKDKYQNAT